MDSPAKLPGPALLFTPATRPDRASRALARADGVILDLEDAVAATEKTAARAHALALLSELDRERVAIVRVNALGTPWATDDLSALADLERPPLVMLPKVEAAADLRAVAALASRIGVVALCESAAGIVNAAEIACAANCVGLMWGSEDLLVDLGGRTGRRPDGRYLGVLEAARSHVLLAATAAGKPAIDAVTVDLADRVGLERDAGEAADSGFAAKACIHPDQVGPVRAAFAPSPAQLSWATQVLGVADQHTGAFRHDGQMIDAPVLSRARNIIRLGVQGLESGDEL